MQCRCREGLQLLVNSTSSKGGRTPASQRKKREHEKHAIKKTEGYAARDDAQRFYQNVNDEEGNLVADTQLEL